MCVKLHRSVNSGIILIRPIIKIRLLKMYEKKISSHISIKEKHLENNVMACHNDYCILQVAKSNVLSRAIKS